MDPDTLTIAVTLDLAAPGWLAALPRWAAAVQAGSGDEPTAAAVQAGPGDDPTAAAVQAGSGDEPTAAAEAAWGQYATRCLGVAVATAWPDLPPTLQGLMRDRPLEVSLLLSDNAEIHDLNRSWRGRDHATNVLSFPALEGAEPFMLPPAPAPLALGDLALADGVVAAEAAARGVGFSQHAGLLIVHGALHLLGLDHHRDAEAEAMEALERRILAALNLPDLDSAPLPPGHDHPGDGDGGTGDGGTGDDRTDDPDDPDEPPGGDDPGRSGPPRSGSGGGGPAATADPATADPATADPVTPDPVTPDPVTADPVTRGPAGDRALRGRAGASACPPATAADLPAPAHNPAPV